MKTEIPLLQNVRVAAPCSAAWDAMQEVEGDRVHFCDQCQKRVYNLSAMGQSEAEGLLRRHEGHLCVRYYRRTDGTILTTDCPVGLKAARALAFQRARASFAMCALFCAAMAAYRVGASWTTSDASQPTTGLIMPVEVVGSPPVSPAPPTAITGKVMSPPVEAVEPDGMRMGEVIRFRVADPLDEVEEATWVPITKPSDKSEAMSPEIKKEVEGIRKSSAAP